MIFRRKKPKLPVAHIIWSEVAYKYCLGGDMFKQIIFDKVYPYSEAKKIELEKYGVIVIDHTKGERYPEECIEEPSKIIVSGGLKIRKEAMGI